MAIDFGPENVPDQHQPMRGDPVETWLKYNRDLHTPPTTLEWEAINWLLDEYRERADTGRPLGTDEDDG